jgi:hypothetical protein
MAALITAADLGIDTSMGHREVSDTLIGSG